MVAKISNHFELCPQGKIADICQNGSHTVYVFKVKMLPEIFNNRFLTRKQMI